MRSPPPSASSRHRSAVRSACRSRPSTASITTTSYSYEEWLWVLVVGIAPLAPAAGRAPQAAANAEAAPARRPLRLAVLAIGGATILGAVAVIAWELAAARVPQHRAALEELIREQTGLDVSFHGLS